MTPGNFGIILSSSSFRLSNQGLNCERLLLCAKNQNISAAKFPR